jgi:hypothetical protein
MATAPLEPIYDDPAVDTSPWVPPPTVKDHLGGTLPPESDFFVAPPGEIGKVKSAYTTLKKQDRPRPFWTRAAIAAIPVAVPAAVWVVGLAMDSFALSAFGAMFALLLLFLGMPFAWYATEFKHSCNFVGTEGCARFACKGKRETLSEKSIFRYQEAWALTTLITQTTRTNLLGRKIRGQTTFRFCWHAPQSEKIVYQIAGQHPAPNNPYDFARAVEAAFNDYLLPRLEAELASKGYISFYMGQGRWALVGRGVLEIVDPKGNRSRCEAADIGSAQLAAGVFTITRKDATSKFFGLLGTTGVFSFGYYSLYNPRLFLFAFERLLNIKVEYKAE